MSQMPIPKTERVSCPIWARRVYREPLDASTLRPWARAVGEPARAAPTFAPAVEAHPAGPVWLEQLSDPVIQKILAGEFFVDLIRMGMVEGVIRAAKTTGADAIVRGGAELGGLVAGAILDLPVATAAAAANKVYEPMIRPAVARAAAEHGLDGERVAAAAFDVLRIDRTPPSLETPGYEAPANEIKRLSVVARRHALQ